MQAFNASNVCPANAGLTREVITSGAMHLAAQSLGSGARVPGVRTDRARLSHETIVAYITEEQADAVWKKITEPELVAAPGHHLPKRYSSSVAYYQRQARFAYLELEWHGTVSPEDVPLSEVPKFIDGEYERGALLLDGMMERGSVVFLGIASRRALRDCGFREWQCQHPGLSGAALLVEVDRYLVEHPTGFIFLRPEDMALWMTTRRLPGGFARLRNGPELAPGQLQALQESEQARRDCRALVMIASALLSMLWALYTCMRDDR